ncbi:MAG: SulP family inorganic anion transporter, partial [Verrucomicrobiota bacterium]
MNELVNIVRTAWRETRLATRRLIAETTLRPLTIQDHLKKYSLANLAPDTRAGVNVALLGFPQGMAYSLIAEIPVVHGIFCSVVAPIVAGLMASSRVTMIGPTNATAALIASTLAFTAGTAHSNSEALIMLTIMIGLLLIVGAFFKVATLTQYVSRTVIIGYITGAALFIISKQLHNVLGVPKLDGAFFYNAVGNALYYLPNANQATLVVSLLTFCLLVAFRYGAPQLPGVAITLAIIATLAYFETAYFIPFSASGVEMLDAVSISEFTLTLPSADLDLFSQLLGGAFAIAFLCTIENTFMAKSLASRYGETVDVNQEMLSLGTANTATGLLSGMPASGSLTRSALNADSGATSPFAGITSGIVCLLVVLLLGTFVEYIPVASLAVVVVVTAVTLIRPKD